MSGVVLVSVDGVHDRISVVSKSEVNTAIVLGFLNQRKYLTMSLIKTDGATNRESDTFSFSSFDIKSSVPGDSRSIVF